MSDTSVTVVVPCFGPSGTVLRALKSAEKHYLPSLKPYDAEQYLPYPSLVSQQMQRNPIYSIIEDAGQKHRRYHGFDRIEK